MRKSKEICEQKRIIKDNTVDCFSDIPYNILLKILNLLPAELLRYKYKYVCRRWFNLITNWILFDQASLIVQKPSHGKHLYETRLLDISEVRLKEFKLEMYEQVIDIPCRGRIRSWCNELLLIADTSEFGALYIFNLITKEGFHLPQCLGSGDCGGHFRLKCGLVLTFDKFKRVYKVLHVVITDELVLCEILVSERNSLSFNHSKWKKIDGPAQIGERKYYWSDPVSVEGRFLHWDVNSAEYILSMDIIKERFQETHLPEFGNGNSSLSTSYEFVERDGLLCLLHPISATQVDMWILKDFHRAIWEKLQSIRSLSYLSAKISLCKTHPVPLTFFKNGSIIIFRKAGSEFGYFAYYLEYDRLVKLESGIKPDECWLVQSKSLGF
ncbi:F-box protein At5g49610-like [Cornus florida]|uniref:F-box protein At5g49610-like n=1 Tax=Cornus florida TaxID=4283 RepID=UPI0028A1FF73|nr:F-box protein At5g49610-like [Cornus florida]